MAYKTLVIMSDKSITDYYHCELIDGKAPKSHVQYRLGNTLTIAIAYDCDRNPTRGFITQALANKLMNAGYPVGKLEYIPPKRNKKNKKQTVNDDSLPTQKPLFGLGE